MRTSWFRLASHPAVVRAGGLWMVLRQARLAWRLLRDERVPAPVKLIVPAALLYLVSPLDVVPDLVPLLGQVDDVSLVMLALLAFLKLCPREVVAEHERALAGEPPRPADARAEPIDARYQWVDPRARP
jgi:uncharacterized membrane protein YkvA (DUF1232 family)